MNTIERSALASDEEKAIGNMNAEKTVQNPSDAETPGESNLS
jgi:hypothetical protein